MNHMDQLTPRAAQIMDLALQGVASGQIAERLNMNPHYISLIQNAPNFQHQLSIRRARLEDRIDDKIVNATVEAGNVFKASAVKAAQKMCDLLDSCNESMVFKAADNISDRAGVIKQTGGASIMQQVVIIDDKAAKIIEDTLMMDSLPSIEAIPIDSNPSIDGKKKEE